MSHDGDVHTRPARRGAGWWNQVGGRTLSKHRTREVAMAAGQVIARELDVSHVAHRSDGSIAERDGVPVTPEMSVWPGE